MTTVWQYKPRRHTGVRMMLDANVISARQKDAFVSQLELWRDDEVIQVLMSEVANEEASQGGNETRREKAASIISTNSWNSADEARGLRASIAAAIFPNAALTEQDNRDVEIVYEAAKWHSILVTNDGLSKKQPRGILGSWRELAESGVTVMRPADAVALARQKIAERDTLVSAICRATGTPVPDWVGKD